MSEKSFNPANSESPAKIAHLTANRLSKGQTRFNFAHWLILLALSLCMAIAARADTLEDWRNAVTAARHLAENDAQQACIEAQRLLVALPKNSTPFDHARVLNALARAETYAARVDAVAKHAQQALNIATPRRDRIGQAEAQLNITLNAINQARVDASMAAAVRSVELLEGVDRPDLLGEAMLRMAMMYRRVGDFDRSVTMAMQAMEIAKRGNNPYALTFAHQGMAISFEQSGRNKEALEHYQAMRKHARAAGSKMFEAHAMQGIATQLESLGDTVGGEKLAREALGMFRALHTPFSINFSLFAIADNLRKQGRYAEALTLLDEVIANYGIYPNRIGLWFALTARSRDLQSLNRIKAARADAERAYALAQEVGVPVYLGGSARRMSEIAAVEGDYPRAYKFSVEAEKMASKSILDKSSARIVELTKRYETESKQRKINELTLHAAQQDARQRWLWSVLGGSVALLLLTGYFIIRLRRSREEIRVLNIGLEQRVEERTSELLQSRHSLEEAQRIAHVGSWALDHVSNKLIWSDETHRIFEIAPPLFGGTYEAFLDTTHPEDRDRVHRAFTDSVGKRNPYEIEHRLIFPDGRVKYVLEHCETSYAADGRPLCSLGTTQDITVRKVMENALHESRHLLTEAQRIAQVGSWEYDIASDTHTWSDELFRIYEIDPAKEGASYEGCLNVTHPDDRDAITRAYLDSVETGQPYESEHRLLMMDGRIKYVHERCETVCGADGTLLRAVGMMQDITERKQLEIELRDSRNFLDSVIDSVPDPIFVKDRQHRWVLLNDANCKFTGMSREALIGKSDYDIFPKEQADVFWEKDELVFGSGKVNLNEECFTSSDGVTHHIQTKKTPFVSADGSQMLVGVIRDITERIHYETAREAVLAEAQRLAKMRSEFIAHMSHELRTPLNGILGYAQMLGRDSKLDEKQHASMDVIRQSGEHLLALIEDILDLARIESGRLELDLGDIPLARFLNVVAGIVGLRAKQKQLEFVCEFASDLPQGIRGDDKRLRQVLLNLLSNAVKFTDSGRVTLSVSRVTPSRLAFAVKDTGIGIESSDREAIFQSFEQVSDTQHRSDGTGLGLSISRQLVRLMGGDIVVGSRPGEGSTFRFELELPDANIEPDGWRLSAVGTQPIEPDGENELAEAQIAPPQEELQALHQLALQGNMRDIAAFAERIIGIDPRYRPFAERLRRMANGYQSKAILAFVKEHLK
ncbi:MAG: PAS domain S-box protein [Gallionellaceae bacterium]|jgi:PAS domain S-box-containing protein